MSKAGGFWVKHLKGESSWPMKGRDSARLVKARGIGDLCRSWPLENNNECVQRFSPGNRYVGLRVHMRQKVEMGRLLMRLCVGSRNRFTVQLLSGCRMQVPLDPQKVAESQEMHSHCTQHQAKTWVGIKVSYNHSERARIRIHHSH